MTARQNHGFVYESMISKKMNFVLVDNYTDPYDAYTKSGIPVQIKCIKENSSIDMGDIFRNSSKDKDFFFIVGFYNKIEDGVPNITNQYILFINHRKWNKLFEFSYYDDIKKLIKDISNNHSDDIRWKKETKHLKSLWNKNKRYIQPRFKRDHKKQKRVQCAITNKLFFSYFVKEFEWQKTENIN